MFVNIRVCSKYGKLMCKYEKNISVFLILIHKFKKLYLLKEQVITFVVVVSTVVSFKLT